MNTYADKTQKNKRQSVAAETSQIQSVRESTFQIADNRPEAVAQRKLQEMANNSPRVSPLRAFQEMANNSPQANQAAQLQAMVDSHSAQKQPIQKKENNTGLPDNLKTGIENLSGYLMDDVKVHRNSDKPAQLQTHAYAQGTDIHLASGKEKHLPHEAWHVVQQKQNRVSSTKHYQVIAINDDPALEREADRMGEKANVGQLQVLPKALQQNKSGMRPVQRMNRNIVQKKLKIELPKGKLDVTKDDSSGITFYKLDTRYAAETYIYERAIEYNKSKDCIEFKDKILENQFHQFLTSGLKVYRGVPRWHANWHDLIDHEPITPLGSGRYPDFSTNDTIFIPFTADAAVATKAAVSRKGMGAKDDTRFVHGYSLKDNFYVGMVVSATLKRTSPAGFFNASEVQVGGPINDYFIYEKYKMGDDAGDVFGSESVHAGKKLSLFFDEKPTQDEILEYVSEHGNLLHNPNLVIGASAASNKLAITNVWKSLSPQQQRQLMQHLRNTLGGPMPSDEEIFGQAGAVIGNDKL